MKYLCLIYSDEAQWPKLPQAENEKMLSEYREFGESIKSSGHHLAGYRLHPTSMATTIRSRNGKISTTDGPFAETKEQLGGYYIIDVPDLDEAVKWAARCPAAQGGSIEVRPVGVMPAAA